VRVILGSRKTSRTTQLIELCHEAEMRGEVSYIICHSQEEAYRIATKATEMNKPISFPISYDEFTRGQYYGKTISHFFFDNADKYLQSLTPVHIAAIVVEKEPLDD
jgi:hypothetical protein